MDVENLVGRIANVSVGDIDKYTTRDLEKFRWIISCLDFILSQKIERLK